MVERSPRWRRCGVWTGGTVAAIALSPNFMQDGLMLAATAAGIYRSTDGGQQWEGNQQGLSDPRIMAVAFAPVSQSAPLTAYAATADGQLFQSHDSGIAWQELSAWSGLGLINAITPSPNFATDHTLFVATAEGVFRSQDGGQSWESSTFGLLDLEILCLACAPNFAENELLWAGSALGGLYRSRNGARSWRDSGQGLPDMAFQCIAVSPHFAQDQTLYVGTESDGIYRSSDGGASWEALTSQLAGQSINCLAISHDGQTLLAGAGEGVYRSSDGGQQWALTMRGAFLALTLTIAPDGKAVAGAYQEGVFRLPADGNQWQTASTDLAAHVPPVVFYLQAKRFCLLDVEGALVYSDDAGGHWQSLTNALSEELVSAVALAVDAKEALLYAATTQALYVIQPALTSTDWRQYALPNLTAAPALLACSANAVHDQVLLLADELGNLYRSDDGGVQWQPLIAPWMDSQLLHLCFAPSDPTIYAVSAQPDAEHRYLLQLWQTTDGGNTWLGLADFYADTPTAAITLPLDPVEQPIFIGVSNRLIKIYRQPADLTWVVTQQFLADAVRITSITTTDHYRADHTLYVTTNQGVLQSSDGGAIWRAEGEGLASRTIVAFVPESVDHPAYAVELGGAIWER